VKHDLALIKEFLDSKLPSYNQKKFIENDPISIPHLFSKKEDIEISGFLTATISWGNRASIITNSRRIMEWMDYRPYEFIIGHSKNDLKLFSTFVHRTFNSNDCIFFLKSLQNIYMNHGGLESSFAHAKEDKFDLIDHIMAFRYKFLEIPHVVRVEKHISNPAKNSAAKRLCMFLRWMVRNDKKGVDFGIWTSISPAQLCLPLDVHTGNISRKLGLLKRTQNDWQAVMEITNVLKSFDDKDPIKYDFALFGLGVDKTFKVL